MEKYVIMLNIHDGLENCNVLRTLEKERSIDDIGETIGYDVVEIETEDQPILKTAHGDYIPSVIDKTRIVTYWKPVA